MPLDEDQCKSEAVRLLWDGDGLQKLLGSFARKNGMLMPNCTVTETFNTRNSRMEFVRLRGGIYMAERGKPEWGRRRVTRQEAQWMTRCLKRFAKNVLRCDPKLSTREGVVYVDFLVKIPEPAMTQE